VLKNVTSYRDSDRVNSSSKYLYDRKTHFKDCYKCYQGKQNCTIPQVLYDDLEEQFELHYLLFGDKSTPKKERFKKITKEHVKMFLKELGYIKHYENVILIHYNMTGKKPDDIGHLENRLDEDFDKLLNLYDLRYAYLDRSNFLKNQYILFQLLMRYKHPCKKEDFSNILRTIDRKVFHDEICKELFEELGWNHTPFF